MKNKFKYNVYIQTLKQLMIPAMIFGLVCIVFTVINMSLSESSSYAEQYINLGIYRRYYVKLYDGQPTAASFAPALFVLMYVGSAVFTYIAFKYLNSREASDFYDSLAYSRAKGYLQRILAVISVQYLIILLTMGVSTATMLVNGISFDALFIPKLILSYMASSALIIGVVAIAMSITGNLLFNVIAAFVIFAVPRFLLFAIDRMIIGYVGDIFVDISKLGIFLNPVYNIPTASILDLSGMWTFYGVSETLIHPGAIAYTFILGLIYLGLGFILMKKRKSELAGRGVANSYLGHVLCALAVSPLLIYAFYSLVKTGVFNLQLASGKQRCAVFIGAGFLLFFVAEYLLSRNFKKMFRAVPVFLAALVVSFGFIYVSREAGAAVSDNVPDVSEVEYVKIDENYAMEYQYKPLYKYGNLLTKEVEFTDEELISLLIDSLEDNIDMYDEKREGNYEYVSYLSAVDIYCEFKLKNGKSIGRYISVFTDDYDAVCSLVQSNEEYKSLSYSLPELSELTDISYYYVFENDNDFGIEMYEAFVEDYEAADEETKTEILFRTGSYIFSYFDGYYGGSYLPEAYLSSFTVSGKTETGRFSRTYYISKYVPKTAALYIEAVNDVTAEGILDKIEEIKEGLEGDTFIYLNFDFIFTDNSLIDDDTDFTLCFNKDGVVYADVTEDELSEVYEMLEPANFTDVTVYSNIIKVMLTYEESQYYAGYTNYAYVNMTDEQVQTLYDLYLKTLQ